MVRDSKTPAGKQRWVCKIHRAPGVMEWCYSTTNPSLPPRDKRSQPTDPAERSEFNRKLSAKTYVITAAQNATPVHKSFLAALERYCEHNNAELVVVPLRYKNPTSKWTASQANDETWAPEVNEYLYNQRKNLNKNITLLGDVKIQPTAVRPLMGLEGFTHGESCIVGHTKLQLTTVPTPQNALPKIMTTTGAVTVPNFTDSKAGKQGQFHHVLGAAIVEIQGAKVFHLRNVLARKDGAFIDLDTAYYSDRVEPAPPTLALIFGDAHVRFIDPVVERATFGQSGLVERLNPQALVFHDLLDAYAVSPHHVANPFIRLAKHKSGLHNAEREVADTIAWLVNKSTGRQSYVVPSNHDDMLTRWVIREDWRLDPENAEFYLETALHMARSAKMGSGGAQYPDAFGYWLERGQFQSIKALKRNESLEIAGIECGLHGDRGPHGARGSRMNLRRIGAKTVIGHSHAPGIEEGCYQTGTMSKLALEYNSGPSAWLHTHCSIDAFGKRHLHHCIAGKFSIR
jgi:hypothetical protein